MRVMTKGQLLAELGELRKRRAEWEILENQCMITEETMVRRSHELNQRIKELNCLYAISNLVEKDISLEEMYQETVDLIPPAMQCSEKVCARITVDGNEYRSREFEECECRETTEIKVWNRSAGAIEICCTDRFRAQSEDLFMRGERDLIQAIAERMGRIIERKRSEEALRQSEARYSTLVEKARDGIVIVQDYVFTYVNAAMVEITGYSMEELMNMNFLDVFTEEYRDLISQRYERRLAGDDIPPVYEVEIQRNDRKIRHVEISFALVTYIDGKPADMGFIRDITERIEAESEIRKLAYHDALTGLPNRNLFNEQFNLAQAHAQRQSEKLGVIMLDLDRFKEINDTLGHNVGDQVLQVVGTRLRNLIRGEDIVARMGGDEFMILLQGVKHVNDVALICQKIVNAFRTPFVLERNEFGITTSIGGALYPDDGKDIHSLLKKADIAMYRAKAEGRNSFRLYSLIDDAYTGEEY